MTFSRFEAMKSYWKTNPPVHQLVAAYMGYKPPEKPQDITESFDQFMSEIESLNQR